MLYRRYGKRLFDIVASAMGLALLMPLMLLVALSIKLSSKGPIFYIQRRVGRDFREFDLYKFRSMVDGADRLGPLVTSIEDSRITTVGRFIRRSKIDELPQLFNVLKGDMSLVGPRPEVRRYVEYYKDAYQKILTIRPGITDSAAIAFRNEEEMMQAYEDKERGYLEEILPKKIALYSDYLEHITFGGDLALILKTLKVL